MHWEFVIPGYIIVLGGIALYGGLLIRRGRRLAEQLPPERRRFLD